MYKLNSCINAKKVHKSKLSKNPKAVEYFEKYPKQTNWNGMSENPNAVHLFEKNIDKLNWKGVCKNPSLEAMRLLSKNPANIDWDIVYENPSCISLLEMLEQISGEKFWKQIDWYQIWKHPDVFRLLEKYPKKDKHHFKISWKGLSQNPSPKALNMLKKYLSKADFEGLFKNSNPDSLGLLMKFLEIGGNRLKYDRTNRKVFAKACENPNVVRHLSESIYKLEWGHWKILSANPHAIPLLEKHPHKINWSEIYKNPNAGPLIEKYESYPNKVSDFHAAVGGNTSYDDDMDMMMINIELHDGDYDWHMWEKLAQNPNSEMVARIIERNPGNVDWKHMSDHPGIFKLDYAGLKKRCGIFSEDLVKVCMHPSKIQRLLDMGYEIEDLEDLM